MTATLVMCHQMERIMKQLWSGALFEHLPGMIKNKTGTSVLHNIAYEIISDIP